MKKTKTYSRAFVALLSLALLGSAGFVQATGYGGGNHDQKVTVCKATGSRFLPYVKVTVPSKVADQFLDKGGVLPDEDGDCPKGIDIRDYIREKEHNAYQRFSSFFHNTWSHFSFRNR